MDQKQRLRFLTEAFIRDSGDDEQIPVPEDPAEQKRVLRSLMNIRMPKPLPENVLTVQDEYLRTLAVDKGVVTLKDIPVIKDAFGSSHAFGDILSLWQGDITRLSCDAVVNAANSRMLGCFVPMHICIDNCIHTFAGIQLREACYQKMEEQKALFGSGYEQPTAVPMLTDAYNLPSRKVIHIVGPIVCDTLTKEIERQLSDCYRNTLDLCRENDLRSVAFCCISTGVFRFPNDRAAQIAVDTVTAWLRENPTVMDRVVFNVFKDEDLRIYRTLLQS